jgi:hypothetical protein
VIAVGTNLLVYAHRKDSQWHVAAESAVRSLAEGAAPWGMPWPCLHEFLAIVTHPRIYAPPTPQASAITQVEAWLASPTHVLLSEGPGYWAVLQALLKTSKVSGGPVHDARIAALCLHNRVSELWSADRDFSRFSALTTRNPLV